MTTQICCGVGCDKQQHERELKLEGAIEFVAFMEEHLTEDCSPEAIAVLLLDYTMSLL